MPGDNVLMATRQLENMEGKVGYSTNGYKVIEWLISNKMEMDKVMMFTDMQMWDSHYGGTMSIKSSWKRYNKIAPNAKLYLFDLAGYGQSPLRLEKDDVCLIAGWSDRVFNVLSAIEKGADALDLINQTNV
jgi:hypothetical protein